MTTIYSRHHFLFPFRWDRLNVGFGKENRKEDVLFDDRTRMAGIQNMLGKPWQRKQLNSVLNAKDYNHFTYYHEFVRKAIYDFQQPRQAKNTAGEEEPIMMYFEYQLPEQKAEITPANTYSISFYKMIDRNKEYAAGKYKRENYKEETITLNLEGITLHLYNTGVGVLSFDLSNTTYKDKETILLINEFGRRIYPQFLGNGEERLFHPQRAFLAKSIVLNLGGKEVKEDFTQYAVNNLIPEQTFYPPAFIAHLFTETSVIFSVDSTLKKESILFTRVIDDRMFFLSWYGNDTFAKKLGGNYLQCDWWYAYLFGDKEPKSIANSAMQKEQSERHTYQRWSEYGTLFGLSRDSFVCLSSSAKTLIENDVPPLDEHIKSIYYQMAVLCLVQRASVLKFSSEVSNMADLAKAKQDEKLSGLIKDVYKNYIEFINKIYFREVTSQIQGIELYRKFQDVMGIEKDVTDLDNEFQELHQYVALLAQEEDTKQANLLNIVATIFLPASFIATVFGISTFKDSTSIISGKWDWSFAIPVITTFFLLGLMAYLMKNNIRKYYRHYKTKL